MTLNPRESFTIVRQIEDHTDAATYYVQAVIRNAKTDALIATINLVDRGERRFSKPWLVPVDSSGQGFFISILTSVYTDSGYTTKSQNYGDKMETYLVQDRPVFNPNYPLGGAGGPDIDYKRIEKIFRKVLKEQEPLEAKIVTVTKEVVREVRVPEVKIVETCKAVDVAPILRAIEAVGKKVDDKEVTEVPEIPEVNFGPITKKLDEMHSTMEQGFTSNEKKMGEIKVDVTLGEFVPKATVKVTEPEPEVPTRIKKLMK